jgi:PhnB protein
VSTTELHELVETEAERVFAALGEGGLITMPLEKTFWTSKFGMLQDRFGVTWMVSIEHKAGPGA